MEMEPSPQEIAKKLWNIARAMFLMLRTDISKSKPMVDLLMLLKRGKLAGKAISNLMLHHHSALSCRSDDIHLSFVSPREYEFSCNNSPVYPSYYRRKHHHHQHRRRHHHDYHSDDVVQKVFDLLNSNEVLEASASPLALPGFGQSPIVRQLRITDSPFPLKDGDQEDSQVDMAAEEFIKKFYKELKHQKRMAAHQENQERRAAPESPSPHHIWAS
ncbi:hypothetical protein CsSME_00022895 [Camellia sinensis var. sinensis]